MNKVINIGPFLLQYHILVIIIALIVSYTLLKLRLKKMNSSNYADIYMNAMLIWGVFWKFGSILWNLDLFIKTPSSILFLAGTEKTLWFGFLLACLYILIKFRKNKTHLWEFLDVLFIPVLSFLAIYHLLIFQYGYETKIWWGIHISSTNYKYQSVNFYYFFLDLFLLIWFFIKRNRRYESSLILSRGLMLYGVIAFFISLTIAQRIFILGLSQTQLVFSFMVLIGLTINGIRNKVAQK